MLKKCQSRKPASNLLGSNIRINRMLRDTLVTLMETMNWLQSNLSTSLQILNMQMDLVLSSSSSSRSNIELVLAAADRLDQGSLGLHEKLDTTEQHLRQLVGVELRLRSFPSDYSPPCVLISCTTRFASISLLEDAEKGLGLAKADFVIGSTHKKLLQLFWEGKASYSDTVPNGDTILHKLITGWQQYTYQWDASSWLAWCALIKDLLQNGLLPHHANDCGETPADQMLLKFDIYGRRRDPGQQQATLDICSDILSSGDYWRTWPLTGGIIRTLTIICIMGLGMIIYLKIKITVFDLFGGLLKEKKLKVEVFTQVSWDSQKNIFRHYLERASGYSAGLTLILTGQQVLLYSFYLVTQLVLVLLEQHVKRTARTASDIDQVHKLLPRAQRTLTSSSGIREQVVQRFIDRRKRLKVVAETFLSDELRHALSLTPDTLLGFDAFRTYEAPKAELF
ncbi:hypothetical protein GB937_009428 [Aspergillus fischeri]|nr:hypothetical protein GB937_009428 [Aspergillus fischeri]